jgi:hypothetical protein
MEGPKFTPKVESNNKSDKPESVEVLASLPVEEVLSHVGQALESCRNNPHQNTNHGQALHQEIECTEVCDLFHNYEKHQIISLQDITESIGIVVQNLELIKTDIADDPDELQFITSRLNLIKKRDVEISASVKRYVSTVAQFQTIKKQQLRMLPEDYRDKLIDIDARRRKAHNSLMETLSIYTRLIQELKSDGYLSEVDVFQWDFKNDATDFKANANNVAVFSEKILNNRDLIKDWAITAHLYQSLKIISELEKSPTSNDASGT